MKYVVSYWVYWYTDDSANRNRVALQTRTFTKRRHARYFVSVLAKLIWTDYDDLAQSDQNEYDELTDYGSGYFMERAPLISEVSSTTIKGE